MVLYFKNVVRPSCDHRATCENSREAARAEKMAKEATQCWLINQEAGKLGPGLQQASSRCANARMPHGDTTARVFG